eukprot:4326795-Amphidinium_carterae.1
MDFTRINSSGNERNKRLIREMRSSRKARNRRSTEALRMPAPALSSCDVRGHCPSRTYHHERTPNLEEGIMAMLSGMSQPRIEERAQSPRTAAKIAIFLIAVGQSRMQVRLPAEAQETGAPST